VKPAAVPTKRSRWLALALAAAAMFVHGYFLQPWTMDDAYIYMRYADNLAAGHGIVFNPGERVEGYTTVVWILFLALGVLVDADLVVFSKLLGILFSLGTLSLVWCSDRFSEDISKQAAVRATLLLGSTGIFTAWTMGSMDVPMVTFLATSVWLLHLAAMRSPESRAHALAVGAAGALAVIGRPECILVVAAVGADRLLEDLRGRRFTVLFFVLAFLAGYLPYFLWRYEYYGFLLPNTFYVKVGWSWAQLLRGVDYALGFGWIALGLLAPILIGLLRAPMSFVRSRPHRVLLLFFVSNLGFAVYVGGDAMPAFRFFCVSLPALSLLAAMLAPELLRGSARASWLLIAGMMAFNVFQSFVHPALNVNIENSARLGRIATEVGLFMRDALPRDSVIAVNAAGAIPYYSRLETIDMLGLNDVQIAHRPMPNMGLGKAGHEKGDGAYVLSRQPDYIVFGGPWGTRAPRFVGDRELADSQAFRSSYGLRRFKTNAGRQIVMYERRGPAADTKAVDPFTGARTKNVMLVVVDTLRADHLGIYGAERATSPAIDAFAADAYVFDRAYAAAPWTQASIATLLTGLYPSRHGLTRIAQLPDELDTLAERLSRRGFRTAAVVSHALLARRYGFDQGFDEYAVAAAARSHRIASTGHVTRLAKDLLARAKTHHEPFFLFVHYFDPHYNYLAHPEWGFAPESAGRLRGGEDIEVLRAMEADLSKPELDFIRDLYDEEIRHTDEGIGQLLEALRAHGFDDDTLVMLTADHGEEFLDHGALGHAHTLYDELVRVPLLIRPPGGTGRPHRIEAPVSLTSITPTVLEFVAAGAWTREAAGVLARESFDGGSLLPVMRSGRRDARSAVYLETDFVPLSSRSTARSASQKGLIEGRHKLVRDDRSGAVELYDLIADPDERQNLAAERPDLTARLIARLEDWQSTVGSVAAPSAAAVEQSPEQLEQLRALGYVEP
jgi:arylsulfatase A-like enzyme